MSEISHIAIDAQPRVAHHFNDLEQQHQAHTLGMWVFLTTEVMFFGGTFLAYMVFRSLYPEAFGAASRHLNIPLGTLNTAILLCSSLAMVLAVFYVRQNRRQPAVLLLLLTAALGMAFLGIKAVEWIIDWREGLVPGLNWTQTSPDPMHEQLFFVLYFTMTGLHALHMLVGVAVVGIMALAVLRKPQVARLYTNVEMVGLYWHFVDVVWVFLFPLLYLVSLHL